MRRISLTRYPECIQEHTFNIPDSVPEGLETYNYIQEQLKHIQWSEPKVIEDEKTLERKGYYYRQEIVDADIQN